MAKIEGGCLCGAVRYSTDAAPLAMRACWCRVCQYLASGNATVNLAFPTAKFTITGKLSDYASVADSGNRMHRRFCPACGTPMFSEAEARPHLIVVRAGTLDDPNIVAPDSVIWTSRAPDWALLDPDIPHFEGQAPAPR
jgi:hypothetical protein